MSANPRGATAQLQRKFFPNREGGAFQDIGAGDPVYIVKWDGARQGWLEIARSRNLRGLTTAARQHGVKAVTIIREPGGAWTYVQFADGARSYTRFADYSVACAWFAKRAERWGLYRTQHDPDVQRYSPFPRCQH